MIPISLGVRLQDRQILIRFYFTEKGLELRKEVRLQDDRAHI